MRPPSLFFPSLLLLGFSEGFVTMQPTRQITRTSQHRNSGEHENNKQNRHFALKDSSLEEKLSKVRGIIFDIDGTIADSWKLGFDATQVVLENNGIPTITEEIYHDHTRYATPERLARHAGVMPTDPEFEKVGTQLGKEFDDLYVGLVDTKTAGFYDGIEQLLNNIPPDVSVGALTNACAKYADAVLIANSPTEGIYKNMFSSIRGADNVPKPKPAADGLWVCCKDMGLSPQECVYVGDSPSDAGAAEAAGMPAIGVLWGSHPEESLKKAPFAHLCDTVEELQQILPQIVPAVGSK